MKIDFEILDEMATAGASASVIIAVLKKQYIRGEAKRKRDKENKIMARAGIKKATRSDTKRQNGASDKDKARQEATLSDTPRARLFREAKPALMSLGISRSRAGMLLVEWLKLTSDDDQLVLATILKAQELAVVEAAGWILVTLQGKINGNGTKRKNLVDECNDLADQARELEHQAGFNRSASSF